MYQVCTESPGYVLLLYTKSEEKMKDKIFRLDAIDKICGVCDMTSDPSTCQLKYGNCEQFKALRTIPSARMETGKAVQFVEESLSGVYCDTCRYNDDYDNCDYCHRKYMGWIISHKTASSLVKGIIERLDGDDKEQEDEDV